MIVLKVLKSKTIFKVYINADLRLKKEVSATKSLKRAKYVSTQEENSHATHDSFGGF